MGETMRIWRYIAMLLFVGCLAGEVSAQNTMEISNAIPRLVARTEP